MTDPVSDYFYRRDMQLCADYFRKRQLELSQEWLQDRLNQYLQEMHTDRITDDPRAAAIAYGNSMYGEASLPISGLDSCIGGNYEEYDNG